MVIRLLKTTKGKIKYQVYANVNGKVIRKRFNTQALAEGYLSVLTIEKLNAGNQCTAKITRLSDDQLKDAEASVLLLGSEHKLLEAVQSFKKSYVSVARDKTLSEAIFHLFDHKERSGRAPKTIKSLKGDLMPFQKWLGADTLISSITSKQAEDFVLSKKSRGTKIKTRRALTNLFNHCINQGWLVVDIMASVVKISAESKRPQCFSVDDVERFMQASEAYENGKFTLYLALGFFAGLRPEAEIERLSWDNIDLEEGLITVEESKVKTLIRHVEISENLKCWLLKYEGKRIIPTENPSQLRRGLGVIRQAVGYKSGYPKNAESEKNDLLLKDWIDDGVRHSFASYLYAGRGYLNWSIYIVSFGT